MKNKLLTLDDLYEFCIKNNFNHFSSKANGSPIIVHDIARFETADDSVVDGLYKVKLYACHTNENRNKSFISEESMLKALPSFANRPILGHIVEKIDGTLDFDHHNMEVIPDPFNDGEERINYIERAIGVVPESNNAHLVQDDKEDKKFVVVDGYIYTDYGNGAYEIIKRKNGTKVSVELAINEMSFNAKEKHLVIEDFYFNGITCLGEDVGEGMLGSKLTIDSFSMESNSFCSEQEKTECMDSTSNLKLIETLDKLNNTLSKFNIENIQKGGNVVTKFEKLLQKYNVNVDDIKFEYGDMSDEELENAFEEAFGGLEDADVPEPIEEIMEETIEEPIEESVDETVEEPTEEPIEEPTEEPIEEFEEEQEEQTEEPVVELQAKKRKHCSLNEDGSVTISYEISHDEIRSALYNLLSSYEDADNDYYWIADVYESNFIYENWDGSKLYRQNYIVENDNVAFNGERIELFKEYLTASEKASLEEMRKHYYDLKEFKENCELQQLRSKKEAILDSKEFSVLKDNTDYIELRNNMDSYSIEDLETKANVIFAKHVKSGAQYSFAESKKSKLTFGMETNDSYSPYGDLFKNYNN